MIINIAIYISYNELLNFQNITVNSIYDTTDGEVFFPMQLYGNVDFHCITPANNLVSGPTRRYKACMEPSHILYISFQNLNLYHNCAHLRSIGANDCLFTVLPHLNAMLWAQARHPIGHGAVCCYVFW